MGYMGMRVFVSRISQFKIIFFSHYFN